MIWSVIGITALAGMGGTGMGGLVSCLFRRDSSKTVSLLLSFAAGVMTSVVCFDLLTEALHPDDASNDVGLDRPQNQPRGSSYRRKPSPYRRLSGGADPRQPPA